MESRITHVVKRSGRVVLFDEHRITDAVWKAMEAVEEGSRDEAQKVMRFVVRKLNDDFGERRPSVEDVQDRVESALMEQGYAKVAKAYILYRHERAQLREQKAQLTGGKVDDLDISLNGLRILEQRYLLRDESGVTETPSQMFWRVATKVAMAEQKYGADPKAAARTFYHMLCKLEFLPASAILMNAGTHRQLSSVIVLPISDTIESIFGTLTNAVLLQKRGTGTGFSFSRLRPRGDLVGGVSGVTSGPVGFLRLYEQALRTIKQSGKRQGANMAVLRVDHPDIMDFIGSKLDTSSLSDFNISVAVTDEFMRAVEEDSKYELINPRTQTVAGSLSARMVFDGIVASAWRVGDPGILFLDAINRANPCPHLGVIEATSPCGEAPLLPYQSCNEGSINLVAMLRRRERVEFDWERLRKVTREAVRFLDDSIDVNEYWLPEVERLARGTRAIGLGVMGFADLLYELHLPYDSEEALTFARRIISTIREEATEASQELAERGVFKLYKGSSPDAGGKRLRNSQLLAIAPTGTLSLIADVSPGIEPNFALAYTRVVAEGRELLCVNMSFERVMREHDIDEEVIRRIAQQGMIHDDDLPETVRRILVTSQQIAPLSHIRMQAVFQEHVDGAISKTINYPASATLKDIGSGLLEAWHAGCKGITVYRDNSLPRQVINIGTQ